MLMLITVVADIIKSYFSYLCDKEIDLAEAK